VSNHRTLILALALLLIGSGMAVAGCNQQRTLPENVVMATNSPIPSPAPPKATVPAAPPTVIPATPTASPTVAACIPAAQVADVTVPDGSQFRPGEAFAKVWRFLNTGNCAWEKGSMLVFQAGERLGAPDSIPIDTVGMAQSSEVSITLKAPQALGTYVGLWVLRQPSGQVITTTDVRIVVLVPTPTPGAASIVPTKPATAPKSGTIPPVGSGPFSVDPAASGPWNCTISKPGTYAFPGDWVGDFYIIVQGGPGNYTISDPEHCQWNLAEHKFVCRYGAKVGFSFMANLYVSCPGCTPQPVALYGLGTQARTSDPGTCRLQ
jgi:Ig-like domain from next to BRCA1 gene